MLTVLMVAMVGVLGMMLVLSHPLDLSGCLMLAGSIGAGVLSFTTSCLMGFALFMVMVGGVLVFIAFCVALVPYEKGPSASSPKGGYVVFSSVWIWMPVAIVFVVMMVLDPFSSLVGGRDAFFRGAEAFVCCREWAITMVLLGLYLLAAIIAGVVISSKYSGALVNKSWHTKSLGISGDKNFRQVSQSMELSHWM
uniref:NADH dehydrogenase subunit 6 n=1 Tax=Neoteredo reynei TaxID=298172 RepID=UPI002028FFBF|nr:NADH dehydrogenase subunit 6 [Neoteredo reynei]UPX89268.1 NADH dehydrogenase subunit 6 [Neoteredo reynei]